MALEDTRALPAGESPGIKALNEALGVFFSVLKWVMLVAILFFLFSGVFIVEQQKVGLVLRFGKIAGAPGKQVLGPGLHFALPYPIHEHVEIETGSVRRLEVKNFWYREDVQQAVRDAQGETGGKGDLVPGRDGYSLTGDVNIIHFIWIVEYKLKDPLLYFLNIARPLSKDDCEIECDVEANVSSFLEAAVTNAVLRHAGNMTVDELLGGEMQEEFKNAVKRTAQRILDDMKTGVSLQALALRIKIPLAVQDSFDNVLQSQMEKSRKENEAKGYKNKAIHDANGGAAEIMRDARGYRARIVSSAKADADYMGGLLRKYPKDTGKLDVYLRQHYIEVLDEVLSNVENKYIIHLGEKEEVWIMIGKDPRAGEPKEEIK